MDGYKKKQLIHGINLLSSIYLLPMSAFAVSYSPWQVSDGTSMDVTSGYTSQASGDYALYSSGTGSHLETTEPDEVFNSTFSSTNVLQALNNGEVVVKDAILQSSGRSSSVVFAQKGVVDISDSEIISNASGAAWGINGQSAAQIKLDGVELTYTSGGSGAGINLTSSALQADNLTMTSNGTSAILLNRGSQASFSNSAIAAQGDATGLYAHGSNTTVVAQATLTNSQVTTQNATGIRGLYADIALNNTTVETHGDAAHALDVNVGSHIDVTGGRYQTRGNKSFAAWLADSDSSLTVSDASFATTGDGSHAIAAQKGVASLKNTSLKTSGSDAYALYSETDSTGDNLAISAYGDQGIGAFAAKGGSVTLTNSTVATYGENAAGVLAYPQSDVSLSDSVVTTAGSNAYGLWDYVGNMVVKNTTVSTLGSAAGLYASGYSDSLSNAVDFDNVQLTSTGAPAIDAYATHLTLSMNGSTVTGSNKQALEVRSTESEGNDFYSTVKVTASHSTLNGDLFSDDENNQVDVTLQSGSVLNGATQSIDSLAIDNQSQWNVTGNSSLNSLNNSGSMAFIPDGKTRTVTINGNYAGDGGTLSLNTVLGGDNSATDKLVITGDVEAGTTKTAVNNLGGSGAQTVEGIELVSVAGTSYGDFVKSGRIVAGAYDYDLVKKDQSWYLTSSTSAVEPGDGGNEGNEGGNEGNGGNEGGGDNNGGGNSSSAVYRPEAGAWLANQQAANTLFTMTLNDREGARYQSAGDHGAGMWLRQVGEHNRFHDRSGQLKTQSNRYVVQLGADLTQRQFTASDRLYLGVMAGYGHSDSNSRSDITGYSAKGRVSGYSVGPYATWYQDITTRAVGYFDTWALYNHFENRVDGEALASEKYTSRGAIVSLESGYSFQVTGNDRQSAWIQPKAQMIWSNLMVDDHQEKNGTVVHQQTVTNVLTRVGMRGYLRGHSKLDDDTGRQFQPFVEANWVHNTHNWGIKMDDVTAYSAGSRNIGEVKLGVEGHISQSVDLWGSVTQQVGDKGYSSTQGTLGVKYRF
ncbi:autotransporter outer membrane beta-barrel domain-containing protein [Mangrovibacter plantisponsor]|uniref:Autotransporter family porin n=1 Tax=Mangrovibacter plantisponsor TaxID=451513 RepID=A0A317PWP2_9ENTR|nr:autotransporter outer membrane beta-barrel domain-containing protein [Mangrovibacter plantisponsor]PWW07089.1 autotransporter family porin [Mangrovibacter plantisponsor]